MNLLNLIKIRKVIGEGQVLPWGYGVAWRNLYSMTFVCYPFPFNHVFGFFRKYYWRIVNVYTPEENERLWRIERKLDACIDFNEGFVDGMKKTLLKEKK